MDTIRHRLGTNLPSMLLAGRLRLRRLFVRVLGLRCLIMWDVVGGCGGRGRGLGGALCRLVSG